MVESQGEQVLSDKDQIKIQLGPRDRTDGDLVFRKYEETLIPRQLSMITSKQTIGDSFVLGHPDNGVLGTDTLGENNLGSVTRYRVTNPSNIFRDYLRSTTFKDAANTSATWDTTNFRITFAATQVAQTLALSLNDGTIATALLKLTTANVTNIGNLTFELSADGGSNWVETTYDSVTDEFSTITFTAAQQGTELLLRMTCAAAVTAQIDIDDADGYSNPIIVEYTKA